MRGEGHSPRRLRGIQALRGFAAVSVLLFHEGQILAEPKYGGRTAFWGWTNWGNVGVDVFFILSGFIILYAHFPDIDRPRRWANYVYRRAARIYPVYWLYTSGLFVGAAVTGIAFTSHQFSSLDYLTTYLLVDFSGVAPPIGPAWTLFHEVLFYALFSLLLLNLRIGIAVLTLWLGIMLWVFEPRGNNFVGIFTSLFNLYFFVGMGAFLAWKKGWGPAKSACVLGGFLFLTFVILDHVVGRHQAPYLRMIIAPATALLLSGLSTLDCENATRYPGWMLFIGDASYSIYLSHVAVLAALAKLFTATGWMMQLPANICAIIFLATAVGIGAAAYQCLERPLLRRLHKKAETAKA